ncbi:MAG: hypothetical protein LBJ32_04320 [Oscillospiraceae bacterium]|jgi:hypothetical protein|nr:hypothetical protein [Oscillospiraceae bacterium]
MENKQSYKSWTISDEFWEKIKDHIPKHKRDLNKEYKIQSVEEENP